jgi:hypothetical protein
MHGSEKVKKMKKRKKPCFRESVKQKLRVGAFVALSVLSGAAVFRTIEPAVHAQPSDPQLDFIRLSVTFQ